MAMMEAKILVLGAGGLGCEILKNLVYLKAREVHVVDLDIVELSNLNRQFLFTEDDIGRPKATAAVERLMPWIRELQAEGRLGDVEFVPHHTDLMTLDEEFYSQFHFVLSGLDSIEPRRWINNMLVQITRKTDFEKCIPLIDAGTEGMKGHVKVVIPGITSCWECSMDTLPSLSEERVPLCTIANNPRSLEHIIEYVLLMIKVDFDPDNEADIAEILNLSLERAQKFDIDTADLDTTYVTEIVKKIVPSVITTNSMIAASCCNEMLKIYDDIIEDLEIIKNFTVLNSLEGCFAYSFQYERKRDCPICGGFGWD